MVFRKKSYKATIKENSYFPLALGPVSLGIRFNVPGYTETFAEYFKGYSSIGQRDLFLDFSLKHHFSRPEIPVSLIQAKKRKKQGFTVGDDLFTGHFDPGKNTWTVRVKSIMTRGQIIRVFEQFLYQAFYSACTLTKKDAFLLHSSGVTVDAAGFLFVGASGMGKSTVAELSRAYGVVNDEMNIISFQTGGFWMHRSPFNGFFQPKEGAAAPIRAVFLLAHGQTCRLEPVAPSLAAMEITGQVVPPLGLEDDFTPAIASAMMDRAVKIVKTVPVYRLYFPVKGGFWPLILKMFPDTGSHNENVVHSCSK